MVRSRDWSSGELGLGSGSAAHWLRGKLLPNSLMDFTLHSDFVLLGIGTKSQCKGFGVGHTGASSHLWPLNAQIVWRINDDNDQCLKSIQELIQLSVLDYLEGWHAK